MKINIFSPDSPLYPFRWFAVIVLALTLLMTWADLGGWRLFSFSNGQSWSSSGPGYHK